MNAKQPAINELEKTDSQKLIDGESVKSATIQTPEMFTVLDIQYATPDGLQVIDQLGRNGLIRWEQVLWLATKSKTIDVAKLRRLARWN